MSDRDGVDSAASRRVARRGWRLVDEVRPFEAAVHLPWATRHRPYVAVNVSQWGYDVHRGRSRRILRAQFMWGKLFTDRGGYRVWETHGRWRTESATQSLGRGGSS